MCVKPRYSIATAGISSPTATGACSAGRSGIDPAGGTQASRCRSPAGRYCGQTILELVGFKACWLPGSRSDAGHARKDHLACTVLVQTRGDHHPARKRIPGRSPRPVDTDPGLISIAVSPDGRWAAAGGWNDVGTYIWDLPRRRLERILPRSDSELDDSTMASFSPDSRWLVICAAAPGFSFWEVGTWKRGPFIARSAGPGWSEPVFSRDGRVIAALGVSSNQIRLAEVVRPAAR